MRSRQARTSSSELVSPLAIRAAASVAVRSMRLVSVKSGFPRALAMLAQKVEHAGQDHREGERYQRCQADGNIGLQLGIDKAVRLAVARQQHDEQDNGKRQRR